MALAQAQVVALSVALRDEDAELLAQRLGVGVAQCEAEREALGEGVALGLGLELAHALGERVSPPLPPQLVEGLKEALTHEEGEAMPDGDRMLPKVGVGATLLVLLDVSLAVTEGEGETLVVREVKVLGEGEGDCVALNVAEDEGRMGVGVTHWECVGVAVKEGVTEGVAEALEQAERDGEAEVQRLSVGERDVQGHGDGEGLGEGLRDGEGEAVPLELRMGLPVREGEAEGERLRKGVREAPGELDAQDDVLPVREAEGSVEELRWAEALGLSEGVRGEV